MNCSREGSCLAIQASIRFDHFAHPIDDLVKAEDFYTGVLKVPIYERRGLRVDDVCAGTSPRTFLNIARSRVGLFLGRVPLPEDRKLRWALVVSIKTTAHGFARIARQHGACQYRHGSASGALVVKRGTSGFGRFQSAPPLAVTNRPESSVAT